MDRKEDDTHHASDGQTEKVGSGHGFSEGMNYDPFVLFGPGKKRYKADREALISRMNTYCKRCGCRKPFCRCTIDGGIGRIFMNEKQIRLAYNYLRAEHRRVAADTTWPNEQRFNDAVKAGNVTWRGIKVEYRG
jgi:hypothetical protein